MSFFHFVEMEPSDRCLVETGLIEGGISAVEKFFCVDDGSRQAAQVQLSRRMRALYPLRRLEDLSEEPEGS